MPTYRATIIDFDDTGYVATVRLDGSAAQTLRAIAVSRAIPDDQMAAGRRVMVDTGDHNHPADFVVTAVYTP